MQDLLPLRRATGRSLADVSGVPGAAAGGRSGGSGGVVVVEREREDGDVCSEKMAIFER
ncbi:UNVERIFIED_CONTAM: hypothetical protein Slati_0817200 [Sesamum latifolium]|uniref:Uncharacterized protein n=1 Tax=Sesamum latifolium TaxID=2727402 RepID=A0AAW2XLB0_9LAMI